MTQPIPVQLLGQFPVTAPDLAWGVDVDPLMTETTSEIQNLCQDLGKSTHRNPRVQFGFRKSEHSRRGNFPISERHP